MTTARAQRSLGSISAEHDRNFAQHFVSTPEFARLLHDDCMIVAGAKGSGKTAVMRALADLKDYADRYLTVYPVKLDGLKFGPLFIAIKKLDDASNHGLVAIARATWQNVIAIFVLEAMLATKVLPRRDRTDIQKYLVSTGHLGTPATDKLLGHLERVWRVIGKMSRDSQGDEGDSLLGLHAKQQRVIASFPSDPQLDALLTKVLSAAKSSGKKVLLCFDGLDSVVEYSVESRDFIFAGLIDAVYKCATHELLSQTLIIKALIPKELAHGARRHLRDLDKIEQYHSAVHWNADNLGMFIKRRLEEHTRLKNRPFDEVWKEFFPEKIRNDAHGIEEDSYLYILRHTLYRPRQLLLHVQKLLDAWDSRSTSASFRLDPTFIPKVVAESNYVLAEYVVNELALDFPNLSALLKSFKGLPSVMPWAELPSRLERYLGIPSTEVESTFTDLYNYGIVGLMTAQGAQDGRRTPSSCAFGFMTSQVERHVAGLMSDRTLVAISPMFSEYCGCKSSPFGAIYPSA